MSGDNSLSLKILHLIPTYKPAYIYGGPIFSVSLLCENLAAAGHEVKMLTTTANGPDELDVPIGVPQDVDGVTTLYFRRWTKDHSQFSPALIWQMWKDCRHYDVVHFHSWWNIPTMASVLICWLRGVKPVLSPRGMLSDFSFEKTHASLKSLFHRTAGRFLLRKTCLHLTSEAENAEVTGIGAESFILPNFIQLATNSQSPIPNSPASPAGRQFPFTLLFLSRIHPKKNLESLIEALSQVDFDFRFQIAGMGEESYTGHLKEFISSKGLTEKVEWPGTLHGEEKFRRYAAANLFVLPSINENFANVVIEVLSTGTPVLVSEGVGLAGYVKENSLGWTCGTTPEEIAQALSAVVPDTEKQQAIRQAAPAIIRRDFSPETLTQRYVEAYQSLLSRAQPAARYR
jgi:glycosyltransferase involved in cell wall biosynthesis